MSSANDRAGQSTDPHSAGPGKTDAAKSSGSQPAKTRSPVERAIVWGVILVLLGVVLIEYRSKSGMDADKKALEDAQETSDAVTESQVKSLVTHSSSHASRSGLTMNSLSASQEDIYSYGGILKKRQLYVYYGIQRGGEEREMLTFQEEPATFMTEKDFFTEEELAAAKAAAESGASPPPAAGLPGAAIPPAAPEDTAPNDSQPAPADPAPADPAPADPAPAPAEPGTEEKIPEPQA